MYAPIRATASQTTANNSALPQGDAASYARNLVANNMTSRGPNLTAINDGLTAMEATNPTFAADARTVVNAQLTPVQQGELSRMSQASAANGNEPPVDTATLILDLTQMTLDITGMIEPTPISDGSNTVISLFRGEWGQAGLSALGMIPYLGDAAKLGKLGKWAKTISNAVEAAAGNPAVRKALEPAMQKVADALNNIPQSVLDKLPASARKQIDEMKLKLDNLLNTSKLAKLTDAQLVEGLANATGKAATDFAGEIARRSTHSAGDVDRVVLGKHPGYINEARDNGGKWYETSDSFYDDLKAKVGPDVASEKAWLVNEAFLKQQLESGVGKIQFTQEGLQHAMANPNSFSAKELNFLKQNAEQFGYTMNGLAFVKN